MTDHVDWRAGQIVIAARAAGPIAAVAGPRGRCRCRVCATTLPRTETRLPSLRVVRRTDPLEAAHSRVSCGPRAVALGVPEIGNTA